MDPHLYQAVAHTHAPEQLYERAQTPWTAAQIATRLRQGMLLVAALLMGSGLIFWIAANWPAFSTMARFGLVEVALAVSIVLACRSTRGRVAALFCATLILGGLLALLGQTYQTGADAWQLFASWALLSLIWVAWSRSDFMWSTWVLIAALGIVNWSGHFAIDEMLFFETQSLAQASFNISLWVLLAVIPALVSMLPALRGSQEIAWWSHRIALTCALAVISSMGAVAIMDFDGHSSGWLVVLLMALVILAFWASIQGRFQDFITSCLAVLALNVLFLSCVVRVLMDVDLMVGLLIFGAIALLSLGGSVSFLMRRQNAWHRAESGSTEGQS